MTLQPMDALGRHAQRFEPGPGRFVIFERRDDQAIEGRLADQAVAQVIEG